PTFIDALVALKTLNDLIGTFPFVSDADRSAAVSAILTACVRRVLKNAPIHASTAPTAGTGKGKLLDTAAIIATGRQSSAFTQGTSEEETEKRIGAMALKGDAVIMIDNCTLPLCGRFLDAM